VAGSAGRQAARLRQPAFQGKEEKHHDQVEFHGVALAHEGSFRALVGEKAWLQLPRNVQRRFEQQSTPGESVVYHGHVAATQWSTAGRIWAQVLRVAGAPLPLGDMKRATSTVVVTADASGQGQCWTRLYHQPGKLPQVIRSRKLFIGTTGLEEQFAGGICMALNVTVELQSLVFRSAGYGWRCHRLRVPLPPWLSPGAVEVRHREEREGLFSFVMTVVHPWHGQVFRQIMFFRDAA